MTNDLYIVGKGKMSTEGKTHRDIEGFDYNDTVTGLSLSVRDGDTEIRICGKPININVESVRKGKDLAII